jgi:hypothetical protein
MTDCALRRKMGCQCQCQCCMSVCVYCGMCVCVRTAYGEFHEAYVRCEPAGLFFFWSFVVSMRRKTQEINTTLGI